MIALNEVQQIRIGHGMLLQGEMDVSPEIVDPDILGLHFRTGRLLVIEDDIGLNTGLVEDTGWQSEDGMQIRGLEQFLTDDLTGTTFEQHIIRHHDGGSAGGFQNGVDVLDEIQLLVGTGGPEILAVVDQLFILFFAFLVGDGDRRLFAEGRVGQNVVHTVAGIRQQGIAQGDGDIAIDIADVVQIQIHQRHLEGISDQLVAVEGFVLQELLVLTAEGVVVGVG